MTKNNQFSNILDFEMIANMLGKLYTSIATLRLNHFPEWISVQLVNFCTSDVPK